jgi:hypothetical protein
MAMKNALICLSHGFHVRNIVYSRLYEQLTDTMGVTLIVPATVQVPSADLHLLRGANVLQIAMVPHRFEKLFMFLRKNVFAGRDRTQTFNLMSELESQKHPFLYRLASAANAIFGRIPLVTRVWQRVESWFIRGGEFDAVMRERRPRIVITANYGTEPFEVRFLRSAHRHGVPSLAVIPSWDNLSSKGVIGENPRHLSVWNNIMLDEAISLYGFRASAIHVCGGLQFDRYAIGVSEAERDRVLERIGIDPRRPFVVIGTITPRYFPNNIDIVDILSDAVADGRLPAELQIVVRLHPQAIDGSYFSDNLDAYRERAAADPRIKLSIPRVMRWGGITPPTPEDTTELMTLLQRAVACIIPGSTLAIDACALGTPVIGIGFDGHESKPYRYSVRRMLDFTHYRRITVLGGMRIAESKEMLIAETRAYMDDRSRDAEGRERIVSSHLGRVDGLAWQRILGIVEQLTVEP